MSDGFSCLHIHDEGFRDGLEREWHAEKYFNLQREGSNEVKNELLAMMGSAFLSEQ